MKKFNEFSKFDQDSFYDVLIEISLDPKYISENIENSYNSLPDSIKFISEQWGMSDTVFRDSAYEYLLTTMVNIKE